MSLKDFETELAKGFVLNSYLVYGASEFLLYDAVCEVKQAFKSSDVFNFDYFDLNAPDYSLCTGELLELLNTMPFMADRRIVLIDNAQKLSKTDAKKFIQYLNAPSPSTLLIMFHLGKKPELIDAVKSKDFKAIYLSIVGSLNKWVESRAQKKGITLTPEAIDYLIEITGGELGFIVSEIDKFALLGFKHAIKVDDIIAITHESAQRSVFGLADAIMTGNSKQALKYLNTILQNDAPEMILGGLRWCYDKRIASFDSKTRRHIRKLFYDTDIKIKTSQSCAIEGLVLALLKLKNA